MEYVMEYVMEYFSYFIYLAMALLIIFGLADFSGNGLLRLRRAGQEFKNVRKSIDPTSGKVLAAKILNPTEDPGKELFHSNPLIYQFRLYQQEVRSAGLTSKDSYTCDIGEFFNYELLDQMGSSGFNDHIVSSLTALGVLGTFLGLTMGLSGFETSSSDLIMNGVTRLLNGMSLAFATSIAGISLSLLYGTLYRSSRSTAERNLDLFLDDFRENVINSNKESSINKVQNSLSSLDSFSGEVIDALKTPMQEMKDSLNQYCEFSTTKQIESLESMTNTFVEHLSKALESNLEDLSDSLKAAERCNNSYNESFQTAISSLQNMTTEINGINATLQNTIRQYKNVNSGVQKINDAMEKKLLSVDEILKKDITALQMQSSITKQLTGYADELQRISGQISSHSALSASTLNSIRDCGQEMVRDNQLAMEEQMRVLMMSSSDFANFMTNQSTEYASTTAKLLQSASDHMQAEVKTMLSENQSNNSKRAQSINNLEAVTRQSSKDMNEKMDLLLQEMQKQNKQMGEMIDLLRISSGMPRKKSFFERFRK